MGHRIMAALPYIQIYIAEYLVDTIHLDAEQSGAYLHLIFHYWQTAKPLRVDRLEKISRVSHERWPDVKLLLTEFFAISDDGQTWRHNRIDADLKSVEETLAKRSVAGKSSARSRALEIHRSTKSETV